MATNEQELTTVIRQLMTGMLTNDLELLRHCLLPTATLTHLTGVTQTREQWLHQIAQGRLTYFNGHEVSIAVQGLDATHAQVMTRYEVDARVNGFRNTWPLAMTYQLVKTDGHWQIESIVVTLY